jgi:hypothetical protein
MIGVGASYFFKADSYIPYITIVGLNVRAQSLSVIVDESHATL